ncbi:hypothetical protein BH18ACT9_BH18ACT9_00770 [soil metagenome]
MADRRADDTPLAPRRSLSGPHDDSVSGSPAEQKRPITERVSAAMTAAGSAVQQAASPSGPSSTQTDAPRVDSASPSSPGSPAGSSRARPRSRGPRKARLRLVHLDPWSVMKTSFLLSIAFGIVTVVAVAVVWSVLGAAGVWDSINSTVTDVLGGESADTFDIESYVGASRVLGFTMIVAVVDVVLITAIATLAAFLYNLAAALLGGLEVTLAEDER